MVSTSSTTFLTSADNARIVAGVYSVSLVATLLLAVAALAFHLLRDANAGTRAIVWRCTLVSLIAVCAGRFVPWQWMAWVLPAPLARPLMSLGTIDLEAAPPGVTGLGDAAAQVSALLPSLILLYCAGVALILLRTTIARGRLALVQRRAVKLTELRWQRRLHEAGQAVGVSTSAVQLTWSPDIAVPITWGIWRPVILLPQIALHWPDDRLQAVLRHELVHVGARDSAMRLATRIACAVFWFHPGIWWMTRRFEADAEEASDDRVLLSGVRASDYAEWLGASVTPNDHLQPAMALVRRGNLRARLAVVTNTQRDIAVPARRLALFAAALTAAIVAPLATARLAPTRDVLTSLMTETRWESRAWAVVHLARRADSVDVARSAARSDPDPAVRAWARYALGLNPAGPASRRRS